MNKWKYRSIKIACAFVMALSILPGATYLLACEEEEQPIEPPVVEPPIEEPPIEEPPVEEEPVEEEKPIEEEPVVEEPIEEKPNNDNIINNNNNENNINIDIDIQQQQQKQEQQLKKDNPVEYIKQKSKQVTTKKQIIKVENHSPSNTKSYVKGEDYIKGKGPIDENYVEGKGPIDEDYVENPETGEEEIIIGCGVTIIGASVLLVIIRKFLIKI